MHQPNDPFKLAVRRCITDKVMIAAQMDLSNDNLHFALNHLELEAYLDDMTRRLVVRLKTYILSGPEEVVIDIEEKWPADWWQAVRERWMPKWWLKKWPVRYKSVSIHRRIKTRMCPHVNVKTDRPHLEWLMGEEG